MRPLLGCFDTDAEVTVTVSQVHKQFTSSLWRDLSVCIGTREVGGETAARHGRRAHSTPMLQTAKVGKFYFLVFCFAFTLYS